MNLTKIVRTLKEKSSQLDTKDVFKITFSFMMVIFIINAICLAKNIAKHSYLISLFNAVTLIVVGQNLLQILKVILKKHYQKKYLFKLCIDLTSLVTYLLMPLYIVVAFLHNHVDFIFPVGAGVVLLHFFILPWMKKQTRK